MNILLSVGCSQSAKYKAKSFCASIITGTDISDVLVNDQAKGLTNWRIEDQIPIKHKFGFGGYIFENNICALELNENKVVKTYYEYYSLD